MNKATELEREKHLALRVATEFRQLSHEQEENLSSLLSAVEPFEKWQERQGFDERMDECSIDPDNSEELTFGDFRRLSMVAAGIKEGK